MSASDDRPDAGTPAPGGDGKAASPAEESAAAQEGTAQEGPTQEGPTQEKPASTGTLVTRALKRLAYGVGGLLATVLVLLALALVLLQTEWGSRVAKDLLLAQVNPIGEARLEIDDIDGNWITNLQLRGVRLVRPRLPSDGVPASASSTAPPTAGDPAAPDSVRLVQIDSLTTDFRLLGLLDNRIHLEGVRAYQPDIRMAQQADGSWDLFQPFTSDTTTTDTTESAWSLRLDSVQVQRGQLDAAFYTRSGADSTLRVRDLDFFAYEIAAGGGQEPRANVRNLSARFVPPGQTLERRLAFSGSLDGRTLALNSLTLNSPYSDVSGQGTLLLPGAEGGPVENIDFTLDADPLSFRDLAGFVPSIDPGRSVRFSLDVTGTSERLRPTLDATFDDGATASLSGTVDTGLGGDALGIDLDGQLRGFDPGFFTPGPRTGEINGDVSAALTGASTETLEGTLRAALFDTRFGEYLFDRTTLAARFVGDGSVAVDVGGGLRGAAFSAEGTVRPFGEPIAYDLDGAFRDVDLGRFSEGSAETSSDLDGRISLQGYGTSLADMNLTAGLSLDGSRVNEFVINEGQFDARLIDGDVNLRARVRSPQGAADVNGRVQLLADPLRYQIAEGRIDDLDVAALSGDTTRSSLTGTFRLEGSGTDPRGDLRLDVAALRLADSYYGPYVINSTNLDVTFADGRVTLDGQAALDGGRFDLARAVVYPLQDVPAFEVGSASFQNVDIGRLGQYPGGDITQSSDLNGSVSLEGRGFQLQTMYLSGTARLDGSRLNQQQIDSATVEFTLRDGLFAYEGALDVPQGQTRIAGTVRPFSEDPSFEVSSGTFAGIDVGALAGIEGLTTDLRGEILSLEGTGFSLATLRGNARIDLTGSRINDATVAGGTLDLDTDAGLTDLLADLNFEDGGAALLDVRVDRRGEALSYRATGTLDRLALGRLLGDPDGGGPLTLTLDVEGEGTDLRTATSRGRLDLTRARVADIRVQRLLLDYRLAEGTLAVDTLALQSNVADASGGGVLALYDPDGRRATDFRFAANVDSLAPVRPFLPPDVEALAIGENSFEGRLVGEPGGPFRLASDVRLNGLTYNDTRVSDFTGSVSATTAARDSAGTRGLLAAARAASRAGVEALQNAQVRGEAGFLSSGDMALRQSTFDAIYDGDEIDLQLSTRIDEERSVSLAGVLDPRPDRRRVRLDALDVRFGPDRWALTQPATVTYGDQYRVSLLQLETQNGQQITADGVVDFDGRQNLGFTLENFRLGAVTDLVGYPDLDGRVDGALTLSGPADSPELEGRLRVKAEARGRRTGNLAVALDYAGQRLGVDAELINDDESTLTVEGYLPLDLRLRTPDDIADVSLPDSAAAPPPAIDPGVADSVAIGERGSPVDITPDIDLGALGPDDVALVVRADSFSVAWMRPFLPPEQVQDIGGRLAANIDVRGTLQAPQVEGEATLTDGTFEVAAIGTAYENVRASVRLSDDEITLQSATVESGDGTLTASGTVALQELTLGQLAIDIRADEFRVVDTDDYGATTSGTLRLEGTTDAPVLRGDLAVRDADLYLDAFRGGNGNLGPAELTEEDVRALRENFGVRITESDTTQSRLYQQLAMDLDVEIERDTWLRSTGNPELDVQLEGDIDLEKAAQEDLQLFGSIEVVPERSRVVQFGRRFEIASGVVTFNGDPASPSLDFNAEYNVNARRSRGNEVTITLAVSGRPGELEFELGSSPSMETADILSYIAVGRPAGAERTGDSGGAGDLATGAALSQLASAVEGLAGARGLGLDVIEIEQDLQRNTVLLTAGEYIYIDALPNPLFIAVSQPITGGGDTTVRNDRDQVEVTLEYEVTDGLLVRLLRRESIRLNLRFEYAY